jgi:hypothetical protein
MNSTTMASSATLVRLASTRSPSLLLRNTTSYVHTRALSSTAARLANNANTNGNPGELPKFSLKQLTANPRTRIFLGLCLLTVGLAEGAAWIKFGPRVLGWDQEGKDGK